MKGLEDTQIVLQNRPAGIFCTMTSDMMEQLEKTTLQRVLADSAITTQHVWPGKCCWKRPMQDWKVPSPPQINMAGTPVSIVSHCFARRFLSVVKGHGFQLMEGKQWNPCHFRFWRLGEHMNVYTQKTQVAQKTQGESQPPLMEPKNSSAGLVRSERRRQMQLYRQVYLEEFLKTHGFKDVHRARSGGLGCLFQRDSVYPLHVAAIYGDVDLVRLLLAAGADPEKENSKGLSAFEVARRENRNGSHEDVLHYLGQEVKVLSLRGAMKLMKCEMVEETFTVSI